MKKKVLFISSTGGHLSELLQLAPIFDNYDYHIITEKDKSNENLKAKYGDRLYFLPYGTRAKLFTYIFKYLYLCIKTVYYYFKIRPKYIVTTGTHTAGPMCYLGKIFGSKIIYIETLQIKIKKLPQVDLFTQLQIFLLCNGKRCLSYILRQCMGVRFIK